MKIDENVLNILIKNPKKRLAVYASYGLIGLVLGSIQIAIPFLEIETPKWLLAAIAVYGFLAVPFSLLAMSNTSSQSSESEKVQENPKVPSVNIYQSKDSAEEIVEKLSEFDLILQDPDGQLEDIKKHLEGDGGSKEHKI